MDCANLAAAAKTWLMRTDNAVSEMVVETSVEHGVVGADNAVSKIFDQGPLIVLLLAAVA